MTATTGEGKNYVADLESQNHPVETVSDGDAVDVCVRLGLLERSQPSESRTGKAIVQTDRPVYRLPTEAEWEFACRAGTLAPLWSVEDDSSESFD